MSELISAIIFAIVQGITEWLPISSSGHLILAEKILNYNVNLTFNVALHFGTLMSVFVYFGREITDIFQDLLKFKFHTEEGKLGIYLIIATIPAGIIGLLFRKVFESIFISPTILALGFGITSLILIITSLDFKIIETKLNKKSALIIGLSQVLSMFSGISRSGTTMSTGMLLGLKEKTAIKFSFLMSIPIIFGANILVIGNQKLPPELIWAALVSFIIGLAILHLIYKHIITSRRNLRWFGIYALALSITLGIIEMVF